MEGDGREVGERGSAEGGESVGEDVVGHTSVLDFGGGCIGHVSSEIGGLPF